MKKSEPHPSVRPGAVAGDPLEELFDRARGEGLGAGEMSALWARVSAASLGASAPHGSSGPASAGASASATAAGAGLKTVAALLIGGGLLAAGAAGSHFWQASPRAQVVSAQPSLPVQAAAPVQTGPADPAPASQRPAPSPGTVEVSALPSVTGHPRAAARARPATGGDPRDSAKALAAQRTTEPEATEAAGAAPESAAPQSATASATTRVAAPSQGARPQQDDTSTANPAPEAAPSEAALLLRARRALGSDPAGALALTDEHARRYPTGTLVPEREVLAIEALARLGRSSEARRRLDALRERFPNAANVSRLDGLIGK